MLRTLTALLLTSSMIPIAAGQTAPAPEEEEARQETVIVTGRAQKL